MIIKRLAQIRPFPVISCKKHMLYFNIYSFSKAYPSKFQSSTIVICSHIGLFGFQPIMKLPENSARLKSCDCTAVEPTQVYKLTLLIKKETSPMFCLTL